MSILIGVSLQVTDRLKKMGILQPLNIFLRQEIDRMQRVITILRNTLHDLKLAIEGTIIMNEVKMRVQKPSKYLVILYQRCVVFAEST